ncbi:energy-coupling factor transporter transmembrane component T family protein [Lactococcus nasutitermitis]|uniref:Energy-coupling factor transporter transmembrane component T family protein n=1 Tax=Lactococcus nasutitermitis TaxID=1652957 RepID=A0ABV9JF54_9LACT|nr:energy-coupling factor transporter transmembrane component T [Lactococcus nasutitermitis]
MNNQLLGYTPGNSFVYKLNATAKLLFFVLISVSAMTTYDTRFLAFVAVSSLVIFRLSGIPFRSVKRVAQFAALFAVLNIIFVFLFDPNYGARLYGSHTEIFGWLTAEELFYLFNLVLKYFCTIPLALLFILTTNPSQFASSLNRIGIPYRSSYSVSLALRYIPDMQEKFVAIRNAQEARGMELSKKGNLLNKIKMNVQLMLPLIFSSLEQIDSVSTAMELRRFGKRKKRTWYSFVPLKTADFVLIGLALLGVATVIALFFVNQGRFFNPFR